jgi:fluoroquinolone resistance protein
MPAPPDVVEEELEAWAAAPLGHGFAIEYARVAGADLGGVSAAGGRIVGSVVGDVSLAGARLRSLALTDVIAHDLDASNADWTGAQLRRVVFERCRLTGVGFAELDAADVVFRSCTLDLASFRGARIERATFEQCRFDEADFSGAWLKEVRFAASQLRRVELEQVTLSGVDFRGSELADPGGDPLALRGAIVDSLQLIDLAPLLAARLGIRVQDD